MPVTYYPEYEPNQFWLLFSPHPDNATKKREIPLRNHYSQDLKQRVIYQAFTLAKKSTEIAIDLDIPLRVVQHVKRTWLEIGRVCRNRQFIGRRPLLSPQQTAVSLL